VLIAEAVGVVIGSMYRDERRKSGVDVERRGGRVQWRRVIGIREGGQVQESKARMLGRRARGVAVTGVRIRLWIISKLNNKMGERNAYRVRIMSIGARTSPAMPAAATTTAMPAMGFGLSSIFRPPGVVDAPIVRRAGSGRFKRAESKLLDHVSMVLSSTL
jgi:hypothetical protein